MSIKVNVRQRSVLRSDVPNLSGPATRRPTHGLVRRYVKLRLDEPQCCSNRLWTTIVNYVTEMYIYSRRIYLHTEQYHAYK